VSCKKCVPLLLSKCVWITLLCCLAMLHFAASCSYCALSAGSAAGRDCLALPLPKSIAAHLSYEWAAVVAIGQTTYRPSSRCQLATSGPCCAVLRCARQKGLAVPSGVALRLPLCTQAFMCAVVQHATFVSPQPLLALCTQRVLCSVVSCVAALLLLGDLCSTCTGAYCVQACVVPLYPAKGCM
jgi:hypothetical protein